MRFCHDLLHGTARLFKWLYRCFTRPIRMHAQASQRIYDEIRQSRSADGGTRFRRISCRILKEFFGSHGLFFTLLRYLAPIASCGVLSYAIVSSASTDYGLTIQFNGQVLGCIAEESDYTKAVATVRERLSHTKNPPEMQFERDMEFIKCNEDTTFLTAGQLADKMLEAADVELVQGYAVYRNDRCLGAVADIAPIIKALAKGLETYSASLEYETETIFYTDEIRYEKGTYLRDAIVDAQEIADALTKVTEQNITYSAVDGDTLYAVAEKYCIELETLHKLNPDANDILRVGEKILVPTQMREMPISFTRTKTAVSFVDYDTVEVATDLLPLGERKLLQAGVRGEQENLLRLTYVNNKQVKSTLLETKRISQPTTEQIGVGTYAAAPASTQTVLRGTGELSWPLDGGRISDVFISNRNHRGLDIAAAGNTKIYAAADGVVVNAQWNDSYGNFVKIDHGNNLETLYAHSCALLVSVGDTVKRGQPIALVGTTGHSTGNHLHFEVRVNGVNFDPAAFLRVNAGG